MKRAFTLWAAVLLTASSALAQMGLEGITVTVKMDMPASNEGVDVRPLAGGLDFKKLNDRLHRFGVGVHTGESIMITKVVVKKDHIEVHLGGGGYGTFADVMAASSAAPVVPYEIKSHREKDLEVESRYAPDYWERERARRELGEERRQRDRDNAQAAAINAQNQAIAKANAEARRAGAGSRFNIWYPGSLPPEAVSPRAIANALAQYASFGDVVFATPEPSAGHTASGPGLRKGMTVAQVEQLLGPAERVNPGNEGALEVVERQYSDSREEKVSTKFAGGVLVDYVIAPR